jgi:hypothetical protein
MKELLHLLKDIAHDVREDVHQVLEGDDPEGVLR